MMTEQEALRVLVDMAGRYGENAEEAFSRRVTSSDTDDDCKAIADASEVGAAEVIEIRDLWRAIEFGNKALEVPFHCVCGWSGTALAKSLEFLPSSDPLYEFEQVEGVMCPQCSRPFTLAESHIGKHPHCDDCTAACDNTVPVGEFGAEMLGEHDWDEDEDHDANGAMEPMVLSGPVEQARAGIIEAIGGPKVDERRAFVEEQEAEEEAKIQAYLEGFAPGERIVLTRAWECDRMVVGALTIPEGATGAFVQNIDEGSVSIKLDQHYPELDEWKNCLHIWSEPGLPMIIRRAS